MSGHLDARSDEAPHAKSDSEALRVRAERLKERIYLTFTALAVVIALREHGDVAAGKALFTLVVTLLGTLSAVFTANCIAHLVVHGEPMNRAQVRAAVAVSFGTLSAVTTPVVFLALAAAHVWPLRAALHAATIALVAALVVIGYAAVRHSALTKTRRLLALLAEAVLGIAVVGVQTLAHG